MVDFRQIQGAYETRVQYTEVPNLVYAVDYSSINGVDHQRPAVSTDGGKTWSPLANDPTYDGAFYYVVDPANHNLMAIADYTHIYFSADAGQTWALKHTAKDSNAGIVLGGSFWDGSNIDFGTNDGLLTSSNSGQSFALANVGGIASGQVIRALAGAKQNGTVRLLAVTDNSGDVYGGVQGWDNNGGEQVYTLDVGAANWTLRTVPSSSWPDFAGMAANDINTMYVAGGSNIGNPTVYKSTNGGASWQSVLLTTGNANVQTGWSGTGGNRDWSYGELAMGFTVDRADANRIMITDYGFAHASTDGGTSWKALYVAPYDLNPAGTSIPPSKAYHDSGLDNTTAWQVAWASKSNLIIASTDVRAELSTDGGQTFGFGYSGQPYNTLYRIAVAANGTLYGATGSVHDLYQSTTLTDSRIDGATGAVLFSTDKGVTWQVLHDFGHEVAWVATGPSNPNRLYASVVNSSIGGIYVTNNLSAGAASTWTKLAAPPRTQGHPLDITVLNDGSLLASYSGRRDSTGAFTASSGVFLSTDGGATWLDRSAAGMKYWTWDVVVDPYDTTQNTWYAGVFSGWGGAPNGLGGLYKTTDRGQTWTRVLTLTGVTSATFDPSDPNAIFVTTETDGLYDSSNIRAATLTFSAVASYPFRQPERVFFNPYKPSEVWVTSFGGGVMVGTTASVAQPGTIQLNASTYSVNENGSSITITVNRVSGSTGAISVQYATSDGTAKAGSDYTATSGTLSWAAGDTAAKTFSIPIIDAKIYGGSKTVNITLSAPTGGATLGTPSTAVLTINDNDVPPPPTGGKPFAVGTDAGMVGTVTMYNSDGTVRFTTTPFGASYTNGVTVATGDVTGDGVPDVVVATNGGGTVLTQVKIIDGKTGQLLSISLSPGDWYYGAVSLSVGDVTGDGIGDIAIGSDNGGPLVKVYSGKTFSLLSSFYAGASANYWGHAQVALADMTGDGIADLAFSGSYASGIRVAGFDGKTLRPGATPKAIFNAFTMTGTGFEGAPNLAAGDVNGDGYADLVFGSGAWSTTRVLVLSGKTLVQKNTRETLADFAPSGTEFSFGVRVAVRDLDGDGKADLILGAGTGKGSRVNIIYGKNLKPGIKLPVGFWFDAYTGFKGGVFVG